jgi:hypothetical protein
MRNRTREDSDRCRRELGDAEAMNGSSSAKYSQNPGPGLETLLCQRALDAISAYAHITSAISRHMRHHAKSPDTGWIALRRHS